MDRPTGLVNLGNTCFLNTALQILSACSIFQKSLMNLNIPNLVDTDCALFLKEYLSFCRISNHVRNPHRLKEYLGRLFSQYRSFEQQDTNECFLRILDIIEAALRPAPDNEECPEPPISPRSNPRQALRLYGSWAWKQTAGVLCAETRCFYGQFREIVTCRRCHKENNNFTLFNSLAIPNLSEGLCAGIESATMSIDYIDGYTCSRCKRHTKCRKKCLIWKLPKILVMQFPCKGLGSLETELVFDVAGTSKAFDLKAIGCHRGEDSLNGHYYSYVIFNSKWFCLNDEQCHIVKDILAEVPNEDVYTVVYERRYT
uniref:USP domain-containing protein n=1 Tax=viral metagenome TaxID=1070528 RepID=A0A6C0KCG7_9ZZZZ